MGEQRENKFRASALGFKIRSSKGSKLSPHLAEAGRSGACFDDMVGLAQLAEHRIVVPGVVGSSPISHPMKND